MLVMSELVTNAVNAGCSKVEVTVEIHRDRVRISTKDDALGDPIPVTAGPRDEHGRGLVIVEHVSQAWGVSPEVTGKLIWADLAIPADLAITVNCDL